MRGCHQTFLGFVVLFLAFKAFRFYGLETVAVLKVKELKALNSKPSGAQLPESGFQFSLILCGWLSQVIGRKEVLKKPLAVADLGSV